MAPEDLQNLEKYHCAFLTSKEKGIAKAPRPPFFLPKEPPAAAPAAGFQRKAKPSWFTTESYQTA
jgi:hypothetical protein